MEKLIYALMSDYAKSGHLASLISSAKGISDSSLYVISGGGLNAIVSDVNKSEFVADKSVAIDYANVIETFFTHFSLLPMRFGSIMESPEAVKAMLENNSPEIQQNLGKVAGKFEFGLKIICDSQILKAKLSAKSDILSKAEKPSDGQTTTSVFREYVNKKLAEHRLEELMLAHVESLIATITASLGSLNSINKFRKMLTDNTIVDAIFLIEKEKKSDLIDLIAEIQNDNPGLTFVLTGPWPPYSFVDVTIK